MAINTGSFAKLLWPGLNKVYGDKYTQHKPEYTDLVTVENDTRAYAEDLGGSFFGLPSVKTEGGSVSYDTASQAFLTRYTHVVRALGFIITREMYEDDQYGVIGGKRANALAFSMNQGKEVVTANVYNRAFNNSYTGGDGLEMCSALHVNHAGGTWSNELATAADLSEASLEQAMIDIMKWKDDRGLQIAIMPECLIIPSDLVFEAERIMSSTLRVGTADNDINVLNSLNKLPKGIKVNHYLDDADAWFLRTNCPDGTKMFMRRAMQFGVDNDFDTENAKYKATERYSVGWTDPRGIFGSPGA